jgi:hypothetical protein
MLQFSSESKGMRIYQGIMSYGTSELNRALYAHGTNNSRADQEALRDFIADNEDEIADVIEEAGKANGFDAELVRISLNGIKIKAVLTGDAIDTNDNMKAVKKQEREEEKEKKAARKAEAKADKEERKARKG